MATALPRHPRLNATLVGQEVHLHESVNIGVAVNLDEGLIVPVIGNADRKDLGQLARESRDVAERAGLVVYNSRTSAMGPSPSPISAPRVLTCSRQSLTRPRWLFSVLA